MIQFYFLSLVLLIIGAVLVLEDQLRGKTTLVQTIRAYCLENSTSRVVLIVLTAIVGLMKLIAPVPPGPAVVGDFFPAVNLFALCIYYVFEGRRMEGEQEEVEVSIDNQEEGKEEESIDKVKSFYYTNKRIIGYVTAAVAFFHFLFPGAVLL